MTLTDDELDRYARHIVLPEIGGDGQRRLKGAHVVVIGAGGIGSPAIQYLAAAGIGGLTIVDDDAVDRSNLQRQTIFATTDIGRGKADAAAAAARSINPHVEAIPVNYRLDPANAPALIAAADVVLDGSDSFATRLAVADAALAARIPLVSAALGRFEGQLAVYRGWEPDLPCYRCLVSDARDGDAATCAEAGVLGPLAGMMGSLGALEVIRAIMPFGSDSAGKLLIADLLSLRFRTIALAKDPGCSCAGSGGVVAAIPVDEARHADV